MKHYTSSIKTTWLSNWFWQMNKYATLFATGASNHTQATECALRIADYADKHNFLQYFTCLKAERIKVRWFIYCTREKWAHHLCAYVFINKCCELYNIPFANGYPVSLWEIELLTVWCVFLSLYTCGVCRWSDNKCTKMCTSLYIITALSLTLFFWVNRSSKYDASRIYASFGDWNLNFD